MKSNKSKILSENSVIRIAVCMCEPSRMNRIQRVIGRMEEKYKELTIQLDFFNNPDEYLLHCKDYGIAILDISDIKSDNIETAYQLRKQSKDVFLIFLAEDTRYIKAAFKLRAYRYLDRESTQEELSEAITDAINEKTKLQTIEINHGGMYVRIYLEDISCVESLGDEAIIYYKNTYATIRQTLQHLQNVLGNGFYRCHKSYIVNLSFIKEITPSSIILKTDKSIPVATRRRTELKAAYREFVNNRI